VSEYKEYTPSAVPARDTEIEGYIRYPIYCNEHICRGWEYRAIDKKRMPKATRAVDSDWVGLHFPRRVTSDEIPLLVEDRRSAEALAPMYPTIALLGTLINTRKVDYLLEQGIRHTTLALDEDASAKALHYKMEWHIIDKVMLLTKDVKDMSLLEMMDFTSELRRVNE
jgi:hypothetical protein